MFVQTKYGPKVIRNMHVSKKTQIPKSASAKQWVNTHEIAKPMVFKRFVLKNIVRRRKL